ncbi:conserved protein of unknown function [Hyphomicrobium sp. 1Nfss2.1]
MRTAFWGALAAGLGWLTLELALPTLGVDLPTWARYGLIVLAVGLIVWALHAAAHEVGGIRGGDAGAADVTGDRSHASGGAGGDAGVGGSGGRGGDAKVLGNRSTATGGKGGKGPVKR